MIAIRTVFVRRAGSQSLLLLALLCCPASAVSAAPPQLKYLFPPGVPVGSTVEIQAKGTFEQWPVQVWVDRPGLDLKPLEEKGKLSATSAADAQPGVYWVRLYGGQGTTPPVPLVVGRLPETNEVEPNDHPSKPQALSQASVIVNGQLARRGDVDTFAVQLASGQTMVAEIDANQTLASPVDCSLEVTSADGFVLARNDDQLGLDPRIVFVAPREGTYLVRTYGFPATPDSSISLAGGDNFIYRLLLSREGFVDYTWPLAVAADGSPVELFGWNIPADMRQLTPRIDPVVHQAAVDSPGLANLLLLPVEAHPSIVSTSAGSQQEPQSIELPVTITGRIAAPAARDSFRFTAAAGSTLVASIASQSLGFPLDPVLELFDMTGKSLLRVDDTAGTRDAELVLALPAAGEYRLQVSDLHRQGGERYVYRLRATWAQPDFALSLASEAFTVAAEGQLEIPVKIERRHGFNSPIAVRVAGLPEGAKAEPVTSPVEGEQSKEIKLIVQAGAMPFSGPLQLIGQSVEAKDIERNAHAPIAGRTATTEQPWLTITAK